MKLIAISFFVFELFRSISTECDYSLRRTFAVLRIYNMLFFRYRSPHVRNLNIQAFYLYRNLRLKTLAQTSVDVSQVLSTFLILLWTSREAHTSTTTPQEIWQVSFFLEEYVRTDVLAG